ncbi:MAG: lysylphosphatidylglycerol synthase transmembrane domain-containing protein [Acidobacteriota bacterium]
MKRILRIGAIAALTVLFLGLFLWKSDPGRVVDLMLASNAWWLTLGFAANLAALLFRTLRWRTILNPRNPPPFYATFFANAVGYTLSTVLPVRAGDFARPAILSRRTDIKFTTALGTVLTERVFDLFAILTLFVTFVWSTNRQFSADPSTSGKFAIVRTAGILATLLLISLAVFLFALHFFREGIRGAHRKVGRILPRRFRDGWMHFFDSFVDSLALARDGVALTKVILFTAGIWFSIAAQFGFVFIALRHPLPITASFFITGMAIIGLMIPTPGGIGGFHKACQITLTNFYHYDVNTSVAAALLVHAVGILPVVLTGAALIVRDGIPWRQVAAIGEKPEE